MSCSVEVGDFSTTLINWKAAVAAGTTVQLSLLDANDNEAWSKNVRVEARSGGRVSERVFFLAFLDHRWRQL